MADVLFLSFYHCVVMTLVKWNGKNDGSGGGLKHTITCIFPLLQPRTVQACGRVLSAWSNLSAAGAEIPPAQERACAWKVRSGVP